MGNIDRRGFQALVQFLDLGAHLHPELGVKIGQRLVEQENRRIAHDRPPHGNSLALSAGKLAGIARQQRHQPQNLRCALDAGAALSLRNALQHERKRHVLGDGHMRVQRIVLEDHGDVAFLRRNVVDDTLANRDLAPRNLFQARDHPEQG